MSRPRGYRMASTTWIGRGNGRSLLLVCPFLLRPLRSLGGGLWSRFARCAGAVIVAGQALQCGGLPRGEFCFHLRHTSRLLRGEVGGFVWILGDVIEQHGRGGLIAARLFPPAARPGVQLVWPIDQGRV